MAKKRGKKVAKAPPAPAVSGIDATPERIAKEPDNELVAVPLGNAAERQGRARRFASTHLDRLHRNGQLTLRQWMAGDWYRSTHERCRFGSAVIAAYGERIGGAPGNPGLPRTEAQYRARTSMRMAREALPFATRGFVDRLLVRDELPRYGGRQAMRSVREIGAALSALADHLRLPVDGGGKFRHKNC